MATGRTFTGVGATPVTIRKIDLGDLWYALSKGLEDFAAMPSHAVFLVVVYPILGLVLGRAVLGLDLLPMLFPLAMGFVLIGPIAAVGLYEMSRRRERSMNTSPRYVFDALQQHCAGGVLELGGMLLLIFIAWLLIAQTIYTATMGSAPPASALAFFHDVFATRNGWVLILAGNGIGLIFAIVTFSLSVVSFPLVLDRHVSAATAAATSVRSVLVNAGPMAVWAFIIASVLVVASIPAFIGLIVAVPVLGHATWHLYRRVIAD